MRELILKKLNEAHLSMSQASLKLGRNPSYLQQFIHRGIPVELRERERAQLADMLGVSEDQLRGTSPPLTTRPYAKVTILESKGFRRSNVGEPAAQNFVDSRRNLPLMRNDLPVFGTSLRSGAMLVTSKPVNRRERPDMLAHNDDAYGLIVSGDSMDPEAKNGSTALVDPHKPPQDGDTCVFATKENGDSVVVVRQLLSHTDKVWHVHQHRPRRDYDLQRSEWPTCHTVVGNYSR